MEKMTQKAHKALIILGLILGALLFISGGLKAQNDFTVTGGTLEWGAGRTLSDGFVSAPSNRDEVFLFDPAGFRSFTLGKFTSWEGHTVNGVPSTSASDFSGKLKEGGFGSPSSSAVAPIPYMDAITSGLVPGHSDIDKFGSNPSVTVASSPEEIWEFSEPYVWDADSTAPIRYM
ncbi:MAG: hypothetical protein DRH97_07840, partial [Chloroflexi bacterium]